MQPRHTETSTMDRPVTAPKATPPKARSSTDAPNATEKPGAEKSTTERPQEQKQRSREKTVEFRLNRPQAKGVVVVGTFNNWDTSKTPMQKDGGNWKASIPLAPGRYEYRFVADGEWLSDPNAKESVRNDFGSTNSVLVV